MVLDNFPRLPMTLESFAVMHPRLYRLSMVGSSDGVRRHGLLTAAEAAGLANEKLPLTPRREARFLTLPDGTEVAVTDNKPLSFKKLATVLDDQITPHEWLSMLNERVFFWPDRKLGEGNMKARLNLGYQSEWQVYDTRLLLANVWSFVEIAPINSGSTVHNPARRGRATFAPLKGLDYQKWRWSRGLSKMDIIKEVTVRGSIPHAGKALVSVEPT